MNELNLTPEQYIILFSVLIPLVIYLWTRPIMLTIERPEVESEQEIPQVAPWISHSFLRR
ncbi:hypothetical protein [Streptococcus merionis]|uniref:hypothetical protein n=1 Tax=Streptococcus merionis TaxID=400065 RepID=UPI003511C5CD